MTDHDKITIILQMLSAEILKVLPDVDRVYKDGDGTIDSMNDRSDLLHLVKACHEIVNIEKYFGLTEVERIIKGSKENPKKIPLKVKQSLGYDGCFE